MSDLSISVIISSKDRPGPLRKALKSVISQVELPMEIIVVDDGSIPPLESSVRDLSSRIRVIRHKENKGAACGRNTGIKASRGDILFFMDDDAVLVEPDALTTVRKSFEGNPDLGILNLYVRDGDLNQPSYNELPHRSKISLPDGKRLAYFAATAFAVLSKVFDKVGYLSEIFIIYAEELDFSFRLFKHTDYQIRYNTQASIRHYPDTVRRNQGRFLYYTLLNRFRVAITYLPWPLAFIHIVLWNLWGARKALHDFRLWKNIFSAYQSAILELIQTLKHRDVLDYRLLLRAYQLGGRVLY